MDAQHRPAFLNQIQQQAGLTLSVVERMIEGESGAWKVHDTGGACFVLKTHPDSSRLAQFESVQATTDFLRKSGYPLPRHIAQGSCAAGAWQLIEWLPGQSHQPLTTSTFQQVIEVNHLQRDLAINQNPGWIDEMVSSVLDGCDGYCEVDTLRQHSERTRELLKTLQSWAENARDIEVNRTDVVHYDFHPGNILIADGSITGVIDWTGSCSGDATFDLCTLLFYCYDEQPWSDRLKREILCRTEKRTLRLYLAHMILRQVDWSIRHHDQDTVRYFLERSERIVLDLQSID